jgi:asparagine synthase (glutamine-hydrolysing)
VRDRVIADVPVGVFLSGGLDSSLITALALSASPDLAAFSVHIGQQSFDETPHAIEVARHLGVRHEIVGLDNADLIAALDAITDKLGEPLADSSLLPSYLVCRAARNLMTVALGGDGADELFLGYPNFAVQRFARLMQTVPPSTAGLLERALEVWPSDESYMNRRFLARQLAQGFGAPTDRQSFLWMAPFGPSRMASLWHRSALPTAAMREAAFTPIDRRAAEAGDVTAIERLAYQFLTTYLPEDILTKTDRASMFNSLELRAPFLSRAFAEYCCGLPTRLKLPRGQRKYILKQLARRYLPERIVYRKKLRRLHARRVSSRPVEHQHRQIVSQVQPHAACRGGVLDFALFQVYIVGGQLGQDYCGATNEPAVSEVRREGQPTRILQRRRQSVSPSRGGWQQGLGLSLRSWSTARFGSWAAACGTPSRRPTQSFRT